jgi:hypothetical protein
MKHLPIAAAFLVMVTAAAGHAEEINGFWDRSTSGDEKKFGYASEGGYFPIWFTCGNESGPGSVRLLFEMGAAEGPQSAVGKETVRVAIGAQSFTFEGDRYASIDDGFGYSTDARIETLDGFFEAIARGEAMTIDTTHKSWTVSLKGSAAPLKAFRKSCG